MMGRYLIISLIVWVPFSFIHGLTLSSIKEFYAENRLSPITALDFKKYLQRNTDKPIDWFFEDYIDKYYKFWHRLIPNKEIKTVFAPVWDEVKDVWTRDIFRDVFKHHAQELTTPEDYVNHSLYNLHYM